MLKRSTNANLSYRFIQPLCECSRAVRVYQRVTTLGNELGVPDCLFSW